MEQLPTIVFIRSSAINTETTVAVETISTLQSYQTAIEKSREENRLLVMEIYQGGVTSGRIEALAQQPTASVRVVRVNADDVAAADVVSACGVDEFPAVCIWYEGQQRHRLEGAFAEMKFDEAISESMELVQHTRAVMRRDRVKLETRGVIKGVDADFMALFMHHISVNLTEDERARLTQLQANGPIEYSAAELTNLSTSTEDASVLACSPLAACSNFIVKLKRADLGIENVSPQLSFDVGRHEAAQTAPAVSILKRFRDDVAAFAEQANTDDMVKIANMSDVHVDAFFNSSDPSAEAALVEAMKITKLLAVQLNALKELDSDMITKSIGLVEKAANWVQFNETDSQELKNAKTRFLLTRQANLNSNIWVEFLFGALLSTQGEEDLLRLNPFLPPTLLSDILNIITVCMLRANRLGHTNRCIGTVVSLELMLEKVITVLVETITMRCNCNTITTYCMIAS